MTGRIKRTPVNYCICNKMFNHIEITYVRVLNICIVTRCKIIY